MSNTPDFSGAVIFATALSIDGARCNEKLARTKSTVVFVLN
jgi:hypothetical protein